MGRESIPLPIHPLAVMMCSRFALLALFLGCFGCSSFANSITVDNGAPLWVQHVTASRRVSVWTNKAQLEDEAMHPSLPQNQTHPWALQTRWDLTKNVEGAPKDTLFVMIEMGGTPFCGTDTGSSSCADTIVLFGLTTANKEGDTRLHSYKTKSMPRLVKALHMNATNTAPLIHFQELEVDNVTLLYKFYEGNASFYGVGGGVTPDGGRIEVRELIGKNLVAPLEVFYSASGEKYTSYVTPLVYHHVDSNAADGATASGKVSRKDQGPTPGPCCVKCQDGYAKYYSIPKGQTGAKECGECCLKPSLYKFWKLFEPALLPGSCAAQNYTVYKETERDGVGPLAVTNDRYVQGSQDRVRLESVAQKESDTTRHEALHGPKPPAFPPQVAPVMPTMFTAHVKGFEGNLTEHGIWHYDWPRNRLRNDFVVTDEGQTYNMTQLWLANEGKFYYFDDTGCSYSDMAWLGMLRPDAFENAMRVDPYNATSNPGGGRYVGRVLQDGRWSDHFQYGEGENQFNIWHDIETNLPLYDYGPSGAGEIGGNHWSNWTIGKVPEAMFDLDTSHCKKQDEAPARAMFGPRW